MSHKFLCSSSFHTLLISIDRSLAEATRKKGCSCGGRLEQSNYPRSPFGVPSQFRSNYEQRFSFCCHTCRKRATPPSVRFFGRRWYPAPLLLLISILMGSINDRRLKQVKRYFGITVSESTWKRWRRWWREGFVETRFWKKARGSIPEYSEKGMPLPRHLLKTFRGLIDEKFIFLLQFLSPITAGNLRAV